MLRQGGAVTTILGFHRSRPVDGNMSGVIVDLGRTADGRFTQRIWMVAKTIPRLNRWADQLASSKVILARNLEMLVLAAIARHVYASRAALVYECLDIHRLMLVRHVIGAGLRILERFLISQCEGLIVSSPGFIREYFQKRGASLPSIFVVENKVAPTKRSTDLTKASVVSGPPWRIGWFGVLRCRRSLDVLIQLLRSTSQLVEVVVAGQPASRVFPDVDKAFDGLPGLKFLGAFKDEAELAGLFGSVHFAWTIDYYEAGANSNWLLPNRLYRAALYGAVPLALADVETGRWLASHGAGVLLGEPIGEQLTAVMQNMTPKSFARAKTAVERIPKSALITDVEECRDLVLALGDLGRDRAGQSRSRIKMVSPGSPEWH
jgi:succinoglycan biosynthesis protein ExoL